MWNPFRPEEPGFSPEAMRAFEESVKAPLEGVDRRRELLIRARNALVSGVADPGLVREIDDELRAV